MSYLYDTRLKVEEFIKERISVILTEVMCLSQDTIKNKPKIGRQKALEILEDLEADGKIVSYKIGDKDYQKLIETGKIKKRKGYHLTYEYIWKPKGNMTKLETERFDKFCEEFHKEWK